MYKKLIQIGNILLFIATVVVNALANILPINNQNTGEISDNIPNLFVPAGITFSIWGIIYLGLAIFVVYQSLDLFSKKFTKNRDFIDKIGPLFIISSIANIVWIFFWHYNLVALSLIAMLVILGSLILIYIKLEIGKSKPTSTEKYCVQVPFSIYLGWITAATVANITALLVVSGWGGFGISEALWTIIILIVINILVILNIISRKDIFYSLVIIWTFLGIIIRYAGGTESQVPIMVTSIISICIISLCLIISYVKGSLLFFKK